MSARAAGLVSSALVFALAVVVLVWSYDYEGRQRTVPMLIGWTAVVLTILDIVAHTGTRIGRLLHGVLSGQPIDASPGSGQAEAAASPLAACGWLVLFVVLVALFGFIPSIAVFTLAFMVVQGRLPWRRGVIAALVITAVTWIVFEQLLQYPMFPGLLFGGRI